MEINKTTGKKRRKRIGEIRILQEQKREMRKAKRKERAAGIDSNSGKKLELIPIWGKREKGGRELTRVGKENIY